jgi:hypothetical protein
MTYVPLSAPGITHPWNVICCFVEFACCDAAAAGTSARTVASAINDRDISSSSLRNPGE